MLVSGLPIPIRFPIPIPDYQALGSRSPTPNFQNSIPDSDSEYSRVLGEKKTDSDSIF